MLGAVLVLGPAAARGAAPALPDLGPGIVVSRLPAGGTAIVSPAAGAPVAAVELWFRAPSTGFGTKPVPSLARLAAQTVAGSKPLVGDPLGTVVSNLGGRLAVTVYTDSVEVAAVVPASQASVTIRAMTTAFFAPVITEDGFRDAGRDVGREALFSAFDLETVVRDALFAELFRDGPQHYPALGDAKTVGSLRFDDVRAFAVRAFRAGNATLVVSGAVDPSVVAAAVAGRNDGVSSDVPERHAAPAVSATPGSVKGRFVEESGGYGWVGPPIASEREATAMDFIADYLFRPDSGIVAQRTSAASPSVVLIGQFVTLHDPGVLFVAYAGKDAPALRAAIEDGLAAVRAPLGRAAFDASLASFEYHVLSDVATPAARADSLGWYSVEGAAEYAPALGGERGAYFRAAVSLTPDFVASVARKYLSKAPAVVTLGPERQAAESPR